MGQCAACGGRFFKTLETRMLPETFNHAGEGVLLIKKRCNRCKEKSMWQKVYPVGTTSLAPETLWQEGIRIPNVLRRPVTIAGHVFVGEYSRRMSQNADRVQGYLNRIERAVNTGKPGKEARRG